MRIKRLATGGTVLVVVAMLALAMLAAPAVATINPDSVADEWDGDDTDVVTDFNASADAHSNVTYETTTEEVSEDDLEDVVLNISKDGHEYLELTLDDAADISNEDVASEGVHVTFQIDHDDLWQLPGEAEEDTAANVTVVEIDADDEVITDSTEEFEVTFEFDETRTVLDARTDAFDNNDVGAAIDSEDTTVGLLSIVGFGDDVTQFTLDQQESIAGSNTTVIVPLQGDMASEYSDAADDGDAGDWIGGVAVAADGMPAFLYADEAGEHVDDDADTYVVYDTSNDALHFELGDDRYETRTAVDVYAGNHALHDISGINRIDATRFNMWGTTELVEDPGIGTVEGLSPITASPAGTGLTAGS